MDRNEVAERVIQIVKDITGSNEIELDTSLIGDGRLIDSITITMLVSTLEEEFKISLEDNLELDYLDCVELLIEEVCQKRREKLT